MTACVIVAMQTFDCVSCVCVRIESVGEELGWPDNPWYLGLHLEEQD